MFKNKKKISLYIIFVVSITIFFSITLFKNIIPFIDSQDLTFHLNRFVGVANAFEERQLLPKIYPFANYGFGYATSLFYCDIFLYPFALMYHFGVSVIICYKLCIFFYALIGTCLICFVLDRMFNNDYVNIIGTMLYLFANYHIQNVFIRSALGEVLAMTFIPLVLYSFYLVLIKKEDSWKLLGISFSLMVMSHLISSLLYGILFFIFIVAFVIFNRKDFGQIKRTLMTIIKGTILAILLCAWYLFPMLEQMRDQTFWLSANKVNNNVSAGTQMLIDIFKPFAYLGNNFSIEKNASLGIFTIILMSIYIFVKKNRYINIIALIMLILYLMIVGVIPFIETLSIIQFLFRFYIIVFPLSVMLIAYNISNLSSVKVKKILVGATTIFSLLNIFSASRVVLDNPIIPNDATIDEINNQDSMYDFLDYNHNELGGAEYLPLTVNMNYKIETKAIKTIDDNGNKIDYDYEYERNFTQIIYKYNDDKNSELLFPLTYYKGYKAYEVINGEMREINILNNQTYKLVTIIAEAGNHTYMIKYAGTGIQKISLIISLLTFICFVLYVIMIRKKGGTLWKK